MKSNNWSDLFAEAWIAGVNKANETTVRLMSVHNPDTGESYPPFPICGFAWVNIKPGNSSFALWLKKQDIAHKAYYGGVDIWISGYDQSHDLKYAHAQGMAEVFQSAGRFSSLL